MTWRNRNLYLIGLPGAGKSAIGHALSQLLQKYRYEFIDLDTEIERTAGKTVGQIFSEDGEAAFRSFETTALLRAANSNSHRLVVATGGGAVTTALNRSIMRGSGIPIWIDVTVRDATKNVLSDILQGRDRPLFRATTADELRGKLRDLLEARRPYYEEAQLHFVTRSPRGDERTPQELARELLTALDNMSLRVALHPRFRTLLASSALGNYPIVLGNGCAVRELPHTIRAHGAKQIITVTDANVASLHGEAFQLSLNRALGRGYTLQTIVIDPGESAKNERTLFELLQRFNEYHATRRNTIVVGLGGGVLTDITSLAANLYHRGLPTILVPTTLIGQTDAAIGGKTGIDLFGVKNLIGTFYPPRQVLIDPSYLKTLPKRELHAGLAEVFKYGLIGSRPMWDTLAGRVRRLVRGVDLAYEETIHDSVLQKLRYVESDEFDQAGGIRERLNFGHTFGHALEAATQFTALLHGEAVLLGIRAAAWLSNELGHLSADDWREIELVLGHIPVKANVQTDAEVILRAFGSDKKHDSNHPGKHRVILLHGIGEAFATSISEADATRAIEFMLTLV
ncbi:MAG: bifunctional shikimate kinase/3-dehydroquinate synthase [Bacteroidota bacterium]|nr:bifunctional shikimate kinase/3-dehydroquinate synthase [Bacteroidota bacterium]MDP4234368.1 bifunctional shikimate kinase/3-dehydroquinate synthase [Bacteroidota bacterium]MDP4243301.1 bifunctional shikimate kinase/3-dehydroquinate synthase [Bacteroidota bacterium]MDP4287986.1 bifunctional shikimate kinase/3-dehydroquinate synthase [Bacteroidota bacterium]